MGQGLGFPSSLHTPYIIKNEPDITLHNKVSKVRKPVVFTDTVIVALPLSAFIPADTCGQACEP